ncbi:alpha/beta hydrolase [Bacteroidota bacterium]
MNNVCKTAFMLLVLCFTVPNPLLSQNTYTFTTYTYHQDDSATLDLDLFLPDSQSAAAPLVLFVHGGGFSGGNRSHGHEFCQFLADKGIPAATLTYTLYMKGKNFSCGGILSEKVKAIQIAAYQTRLATQWFIDHASAFDIDTNKILISGSSAGAEAVLQAAYWNTKADNFFPDTLSPSFRYAGVIAGAGALLDINMINQQTKIPTLCYHGTCDPLVPYHIAPHHYCSQISTGYMMMFGGLAIYERLSDLNETVQLMSYCNEGHEHAGTPFYGAEKQVVLEFILRSLNNESFNTHQVFNNGEECKMGLDFYFCY